MHFSLWSCSFSGFSFDAFSIIDCSFSTISIKSRCTSGYCLINHGLICRVLMKQSGNSNKSTSIKKTHFIWISFRKSGFNEQVGLSVFRLAKLVSTEKLGHGNLMSKLRTSISITCRIVAFCVSLRAATNSNRPKPFLFISMRKQRISFLNLKTHSHKTGDVANSSCIFALRMHIFSSRKAANEKWARTKVSEMKGGVVVGVDWKSSSSFCRSA